MTRTVFANSMVGHVWAQQAQSTGKSSNGNFWFEGETIYSYRTPIARIVLTADGTRVALVTSEKYSMTTSCKHMPAVYRGIGYEPNAIMPSFEVPFIMTDGARYTPKKIHAANLAYLVKAYHDRAGCLKRQRILYSSEPTWLQGYAERADEYAAAFGLAAPALPWQADGRAILAHRAERDAKANTPQAIAKRKRERERKAVKVREAYRRGDSFGYKEGRRIERLMTPEDVAARAVVTRARMQDEIAAWHRGERNHVRFDAECGGAALRVVGQETIWTGTQPELVGGELQTSHGASVPLAHAIKAFRFLKLCKERGTGWQHNGHSIRVGHFTVDSIEADGSFRAGCHNIRWPEIERIARQVGVFEDAPSDAALTPTSHAA